MPSVGQSLVSLGVGWGGVGIACIRRRDGRLSRVSLYLTCKDNKVEGHWKEGSKLK